MSAKFLLFHLFLASYIQPATSTNTTLSAGGITNSIWNLAWNSITTVVNAIVGAMVNLMNSIVSAVQTVFQQWGFTVAGTDGVFAPIVMIFVLIVTGIVLYLGFVFFGAEKDVIGGEEDI